jgi:hypothetical protein
MANLVHTEHYQQIKNYWRFNVYFEVDDIGFMSFGWGFKNDKLTAPYEIINGKFYTMVRVSRRVAKGIYKSVIAKVSQLEGREIPFDDAGWKPVIIGQSSFRKPFPKYYAHKFGNPETERVAAACEGYVL